MQNTRFIQSQNSFDAIPGQPIAYWVSNKIFSIFKCGTTINDVGITRLGMTTGENARFVRLWFEMNITNCNFLANNLDDAKSSVKYWVPYNKGGSYRKWYGNNDCVVYWKDDGYAIKHFADDNGRIRSTVPNTEYYFKECVSWSKISTGRISLRQKEHSIFDVAGACYFSTKDKLYYVMALLNSCVVDTMLGALSPTLNYEGGQIASIPVVLSRENEIGDIVFDNIQIARDEWDASETSWDFKKHPLI